MSESIPIKVLGGESPGERRGPRIVEIASSLNSVRAYLDKSAQYECNIVRNIAVLDFLATSMHPANLDARNYLDAASFILGIVHKDLERLLDHNITFKQSVRRYLKAALGVTP